MDWDLVVWLVLAVLGGALILGGMVAFRGNRRTLVRVIAAAAMAAGVVMWAIVLFTIPVSVTRG